MTALETSEDEKSAIAVSLLLSLIMPKWALPSTIWCWQTVDNNNNWLHVEVSVRMAAWFNTEFCESKSVCVCRLSVFHHKQPFSSAAWLLTCQSIAEHTFVSCRVPQQVLIAQYSPACKILADQLTAYETSNSTSLLISVCRASGEYYTSFWSILFSTLSWFLR